MSLLRGAEEVVPGDIDGIRRAAESLAVLASAPGLGEADTELAARAAQAHRDLAAKLSRLRALAREFYGTSAQLGIGEALLADRELVLGVMSEHPQQAGAVLALLRDLVDVRLQWVNAHQDFLDVLTPVVHR